jgi:hypothetical protein
MTPLQSTRLIDLFGVALLEVYNPVLHQARRHRLYTHNQSGGFRYCLDTLAAFLTEDDPTFDAERFIEAVYTKARSL